MGAILATIVAGMLVLVVWIVTSLWEWWQVERAARLAREAGRELRNASEQATDAVADLRRVLEGGVRVRVVLDDPCGKAVVKHVEVVGLGEDVEVEVQAPRGGATSDPRPGSS